MTDSESQMRAVDYFRDYLLTNNCLRPDGRPFTLAIVIHALQQACTVKFQVQHTRRSASHLSAVAEAEKDESTNSPGAGQWQAVRSKRTSTTRFIPRLVQARLPLMTHQAAIVMLHSYHEEGLLPLRLETIWGEQMRIAAGGGGMGRGQ